MWVMAIVGKIASVPRKTDSVQSGHFPWLSPARRCFLIKDFGLRDAISRSQPHRHARVRKSRGSSTTCVVPSRHDRDRCIRMAHRTVGQSDLWHGGTPGREKVRSSRTFADDGALDRRSPDQVVRVREAGGNAFLRCCTRSVAAYPDQRGWARLALAGEAGIHGACRGQASSRDAPHAPVSRDPGWARPVARARAPAHRFPGRYQALSCRASGVCPGPRTRRRDEARRRLVTPAPTSRSDPISHRCGRPARRDHCHPGTNSS